MAMNFNHGGNIFAIARSLGIQPEDLLDFSASINPLGPPEGVREALAAAFGRLVHYPDSACSELREALAIHHKLRPEQICVANGSTELIYLLPRLVPGRRALIIAPPFSEYAGALSRDGWGVDYFYLSPDDNFALDPERIETSLQSGYDLLILGNPGNPTGQVYPADVTTRIHGICREAGCFLVIDEAFMDFCEEHSLKHHAAGMDDLLVLRSMTKFYALPGLRLGYAVGSAATMDRLAGLREPWSVNSCAQAAGCAALAAKGYGEETLAYIAAERVYLFDKLARCPWLTPFPAAANYLLVALAGTLSARELSGRLLGMRILIRDCSTFQGLSASFFRVAVRTRPENARLISALAATLF